jgi:Raf kinase inhibitor-like YbhB/YbcL family protein
MQERQGWRIAAWTYDQIMGIRLNTGAFAEGGEIPKLHTCDGGDLSPSLEWTGEPDGAQSFALIMDDPDAPAGTWNHWLLYDLPASVRVLPQGYRPGALGVSGTNDFGKTGYGGPCPPRGHGSHRYFFRLYAVDVPSLGLKAGVKRAELDQALKGHILAETGYMGRYERR